MKKLFVLVCLAAVLLCGCSSKPGDVTEETYRTGKNALTAIDQYLDGEITADEAHDKLDTYYEVLDVHSDTLDTTGDDFKLSANCSTVMRNCMTASYSITKIKSGVSGGTEALLDSRNNIAEVIGESER